MQSEKVIQKLNDIMDNPNKNDNTGCGFGLLRQKTTDIFATFFLQFRIYANYLKLDKETIIDELNNKVNLWLQDIIAAIPFDFNTLKQLSNLCQQIDNQERYISKKRSWIAVASTCLLTRLPSLKIQDISLAYILPIKQQFTKPSILVAPRCPTSPYKNDRTIKLLELKRCYHYEKKMQFATNCPEKRKKAVKKVDTKLKNLKDK